MMLHSFYTICHSFFLHIPNPQDAFLSWGLFMLSLIIIGLLLRSSFVRKRHNQQLEVMIRELRSTNSTLNVQSVEITEKSKQNELLLKEIHHRVKNNLQVIASLLNLQSLYIKDEAALDAIQDIQNRVKSMSLIHQRLYQGNRLDSVEVREYVQMLAEGLKKSFGANQKVIHIDYNIEPLNLAVDSAIPLGLIINELLTNSFKYAFPDTKQGQIQIELWQDTDEKKLCLHVRDNGIGLGENNVSDGRHSFGFNLIKRLSKKLKGTMTVKSNHGTSVFFEFKKYKADAPVYDLSPVINDVNMEEYI